MCSERIIISLTTWAPRIHNIPIVLDSIYAQTLPPDLVVINFSEGEFIPNDIQKYLDEHQVECNFVPDTKVYKKLIPTLKKYPNDCVISIDDDWIYPAGMIEDFWNIHQSYPNNPISGSPTICFDIYMLQHMGFASLSKYEYFDKYIDTIDYDMIKACPSDDIVYTFLANKAGHPYLSTKIDYFKNSIPINPIKSYSNTFPNAVSQTITYLEKRFGEIEHPFTLYITDSYIRTLVENIISESLQLSEHRKTTKAYMIGRMILKPYNKFSNLFKRGNHS